MSTDAQREIDRATAEMNNPSFHPGWFHKDGFCVLVAGGMEQFHS
jgi:hypothetical protein